MEITSIAAFTEHMGKVRERTMNVVRLVPEDKLEWTPRPGVFTLGDQARHIAAIERYMYGETIALRQPAYAGCGPELAATLPDVIAYMERCRAETFAILTDLTEADLHRKCPIPGGGTITTWKWMRLWIEHEIHHRGQIYYMLGMLGVSTPPIFGLTSEQVIERSAG